MFDGVKWTGYEQNIHFKTHSNINIDRDLSLSYVTGLIGLYKYKKTSFVYHWGTL